MRRPTSRHQVANDVFGRKGVPVHFGVPDHFRNHNHVFVWSRFSETLFHDERDIACARGIKPLFCLGAYVRFFKHDSLFHALPYPITH